MAAKTSAASVSLPFGALQAAMYFRCQDCSALQWYPSRSGEEVTLCLACESPMAVPLTSEFRVDFCPYCHTQDETHELARRSLFGWFWFLVLPIVYPPLYLLTIPIFLVGQITTAPESALMQCKRCWWRWYSLVDGPALEDEPEISET